ncbi:MAG: D-alanyl-D-alanine carboxypeptidase family protein [Candidatus Binatia bacterium]
MQWNRTSHNLWIWQHWKRQSVCGSLLLLLLLVVPLFSNAQDAPSTTATNEKEKSTDYKTAILVEPETGKVLFEQDAHVPLPPASMVKMMTGLIVMEKIRDGAIKLSDLVTVSRWASQMGGSQVYLKEGEVMTVEELLKALIIHSGNDAAVALAEYVAGYASAFVNLMNDRVAQLGLKDTHYYSVHGLPPDASHDDDVMSAADLATLGRELFKFPKMVEWMAISQAPFRGGQFTMVNPNRLLTDYPGADGIKTGYHNKAGFCVTGSAKQGDLRLIVVIMGSPTRKACFTSAAQLLNYGFATYRMFLPVVANTTLAGQTLPVRGGVVDQVAVAAKQDVKILLKKGEEKKVVVTVEAADDVWAPLTVGQPVGDVVVTFDGTVVSKVPALAAAEVTQASWWKRWWPF